MYLLILFLICSFLEANQQQSSLANFEDEIENIRYIVRHHLHTAEDKGLPSPYAHNSFIDSWQWNFTEHLETYSDFKGSFNYLFWWCDEFHATAIRSAQAKIKENEERMTLDITPAL